MRTEILLKISIFLYLYNFLRFGQHLWSPSTSSLTLFPIESALSYPHSYSLNGKETLGSHIMLEVRFHFPCHGLARVWHSLQRMCFEARAASGGGEVLGSKYD